jgi:sugar O-acyltransferase (sialic acid O-acetyltransferase NeuD family)
MLAKRLTEAGIALTTIIDKTALISPTAQIGKGTIVCEMSSVHTGVVIGENCVIQPYVCVGHDTVVGNSTVLSEHCAPGGGITFGDCVFVGLNATIKERLNIENNAIVGMGAAVFKNVGENMTVAGNPARVTRGNDEHKVFK